MKRSTEIIKYARDLAETLGTNDPYAIAEYFGIFVFHTDSVAPDFTARIIKTENYPPIITINDKYSEKGKRLLCAHELGHALLHNEGVNTFAVTEKNLFTSVEEEANLFALALLTDESWESLLKYPLSNMNNYLLMSIIDKNLME